jgi:anaerobic ribonucleoside-triphosphate reductase activating protein
VWISRLQFPVTSLGYGRRVGLWFSGCGIRCPGCIVPETWTRGEEHQLPLAALLAALETMLDGAAGLTISGGEPFEQPQALSAIIAFARERSNGDILVYSGHPLEHLASRHPEIVANIDALISDPFLASEPDARPFIGSANQRLTLSTPLGRDRYAERTDSTRRIDVAFTHDRILLSGVLQRGVLRALADDLRETGIAAETTHDPV